jgi:hypothetical protein
MRDCAWFRASLYFLIASIPPLIAELSKYKSYTEISSITATIIAANCVFQGVIAVRAFIDQSISRTNSEKKHSKKVELINEESK